MFNKLSQVCAISLAALFMFAPDETRATEDEFFKLSYLPPIAAAADFCVSYIAGSQPSVGPLKEAEFDIRRDRENSKKARHTEYPRVQVDAKKWLGKFPCSVEVHDGQARSVRALISWAESRGHAVTRLVRGTIKLRLANGKSVTIGLTEISGNRIRGARFDFR